VIETVLAGFGRASRLAVASSGDQSAGNARGLMPVVAFTELSTSAVWLSPGRVEGRDIHVLTDVDLLDLIAGGGEQFRQVDFLV
jgi:hypothetical protein